MKTYLKKIGIFILVFAMVFSMLPDSIAGFLNEPGTVSAAKKKTTNKKTTKKKATKKVTKRKVSINYVYENGKIAAKTFSKSYVTSGNNTKKITLKLPKRSGYKAAISNKEKAKLKAAKGTFDGKVITFRTKYLKKDLSIKVVYKKTAAQVKKEKEAAKKAAAAAAKKKAAEEAAKKKAAEEAAKKKAAEEAAKKKAEEEAAKKKAEEEAAKKAAEEEAARKAAEEELNQKKTDASNELDQYKDAADYRADQQSELADAIAAGKQAIADAATVEEVDAELTAAKSIIDEIKTDEQLKEDADSHISRPTRPCSPASQGRV